VIKDFGSPIAGILPVCNISNDLPPSDQNGGKLAREGHKKAYLNAAQDL